MFRKYVALFFFLGICGYGFAQNSYDIVIYGGSSAGVSAAIQAARMNKSVVILEPYNRLGGLTTGGLGATDIGNKRVIGGISREFYQNLKKHYSQDSNWEWQERDDYLGSNQRRNAAGDDGMWTFEPSAALKVYHEMLEPYDIDIFYNKKLDRQNGVSKDGATIRSVAMEDGSVYTGKVFIDGTYEGDLLAAAGVSYTVGREDNSVYDETLNGFFLAEYHKQSGYHQFPDGVDPFVEKGNPSSGLLWGISTNPPTKPGQGDDLVQAYNFRMCLTDHPENKLAITKPENYDVAKYELLVRLFEAQPDRRDIDQYFIWSEMPNRKTDVNNRGGFSTDAIDLNHNWPEASYEVREAIFRTHLDYTQGLLYFYQNDPRVPEELQNFVKNWGYPRDEYTDTGHFTPQLYVREGRRMVSDLVMTQHHCQAREVVQDAVGMAAYGMDSHNTQRIVVNGMVKNEGNVEVGGFQPYPVSFQSITPREEECNNLVVPICLSASHIAYGSIRMEPVFMVLGQSAATAAALAIDQSVSVQDVPYEKLKERIVSDGQILE